MAAYYYEDFMLDHHIDYFLISALWPLLYVYEVFFYMFTYVPFTNGVLSGIRHPIL